jgi:hypothetical protein
MRDLTAVEVILYNLTWLLRSGYSLVDRSGASIQNLCILRLLIPSLGFPMADMSIHRLGPSSSTP